MLSRNENLIIGIQLLKRALSMPGYAGPNARPEESLKYFAEAVKADEDLREELTKFHRLFVEAPEPGEELDDVTAESSLSVLVAWVKREKKRCEEKGSIFDTGFRCVSEDGTIWEFDPEELERFWDEMVALREDITKITAEKEELSAMVVKLHDRDQVLSEENLRFAKRVTALEEELAKIPWKGKTANEVKVLHRGEMVQATRDLSQNGVIVRKGMVGVVYERYDEGKGNWPTVRWFTGDSCYVYEGDVRAASSELVSNFLLRVPTESNLK